MLYITLTPISLFLPLLMIYYHMSILHVLCNMEMMLDEKQIQEISYVVQNGWLRSRRLCTQEHICLGTAHERRVRQCKMRSIWWPQELTMTS